MASEQSEMLKKFLEDGIELMRGCGVIFCAICDKYPATCFGVYEDPGEKVGPACDSCCGHGNEDGWCRPITEVFTKLNEYKKELEVIYE